MEPLVVPEDCFVDKPHAYQLKAAAQALYCVKELGLFILGDPTGLGKTFMAVLMAWALRKQPGVVLILVPGSLRNDWHEYLNMIGKTVSISPDSSLFITS